MSTFTVYVPEVHIQPYVVKGVETAEEAKQVMASAEGPPEGVSVRYDRDARFFNRTMSSSEHYYEVLEHETEGKFVFDEDNDVSEPVHVTHVSSESLSEQQDSS